MKRLSLISSLILCFSSVAHADAFSVSSATLSAGKPLGEAHVFNGFGCEGKNISPALTWKNAPAGTRSFAVTMYDPDAPTGSGWWHWVVYNIPASAQGLPENAGNASGQGLPAGAVQGRTDFGSAAYGGACPPKGNKPHRYQITLHALKTERLDLPADASAALVGFMLHGNRLASTTLQVTYGR